MRIFYKKYSAVLSCLLLLLLARPAAAQMKFGGYPVFRNDAVLELGSGKKGLLLPRVNAAALSSHPLDTAAAGMLVFNTTDQSLYFKKLGALTPWTRLNDAAAYALSGLSDVNFSSLLNGQLLRFNAGKWQNWTPDFIANTQVLTFTGGDIESNTTLSGNIALNLRNVITPGTFAKVTVNAKGLVTAGSALAATDIVAGSANYIQNQNAADQAASFRLSGTGTLGSLTVGGATNTNTLAVTGAATAASATVSGAVNTNTLAVTGAATAGSATISGATTTNTLGVTGLATAGSLDVNGTFALGANGTTLTSIQKTVGNVTDNTSFNYNNVRVVSMILPAGIVLKLTDNIILNPRTNLNTRIGIAWCRVTNVTTREVTICFTNTGDPQTVGNVAFDVTIIQL